jgi:hypothetical protein
MENEKKKGFKAPFDSMKVLIDAAEIMKSGDEKIVNLIDYAERLEKARDVMMESYESLKRRAIQESAMNAEEVQVIIQKANDEIMRIQKERDDEKAQYFALQKVFQNQIESNKIKFDNLVKRILEVRVAQKSFFDKKKKMGNAPQELELSKRLENDLDNYLNLFKANLFYVK